MQKGGRGRACCEFFRLGCCGFLWLTAASQKGQQKRVMRVPRASRAACSSFFLVRSRSCLVYRAPTTATSEQDACACQQPARSWLASSRDGVPAALHAPWPRTLAGSPALEPARPAQAPSSLFSGTPPRGALHFWVFSLGERNLEQTAPSETRNGSGNQKGEQNRGRSKPGTKVGTRRGNGHFWGVGGLVIPGTKPTFGPFPLFSRNAEIFGEPPFR